MSTNKRARAPNFTSEEKFILIKLIAKKYKDIIEDKKIDRTSLQQKVDAWKRIEREFNTQSSSNPYREWRVLKRLYENRKKGIRKMEALNRLKRSKTERESKDLNEKSHASDHFLMQMMNNKDINELGNGQDSNQITASEEVTIQSTIKAERLDFQVEAEVEVEECLPMKNVLSSDLLEKYDDLLTKRKLLIEQQIKTTELELEFKRREHALKLELLELELLHKKINLGIEN